MVTKLAPRTTSTLNTKYEWKELESRVREFYADGKVRKKLQSRVAKRRPIGYVEGPPTLNNQPHIGHVRGRIMKDLWFRRRTLEGDNIVFRGGWDTQGLPIELQAEKEMGLSGNKWEDLNRVGVERLVEASKGLLDKYRRDWEEADRLMGLLIDHGRAYMTYRDKYIEREWKYLETAWDRGFLGEGFKVVPYCPSCQTALSHAEVVEGGYEKLDDPSLYYKVKASDGSYLALWTTMPFTVVTDELVAVKPDADYEYVRVGEETWVICSGRKEALSKELGLSFGAVVKKVKGKDLEGLTYVHPFLDLIPGLDREPYKSKAHRVVSETFVDITTGTGLVHLSPANGEDDFAVATKRKVPVFTPFDDRVRFNADAGKFEGLFARDSDEVVIQTLKERGALIHAGRIVHDYPVCWRSGHRLVWLARREYFYWVNRFRGDLVKAARKVEYFFDSPKNRFLAFIAESPPWCITRERVWGTPLPVWVCEECGDKTGAFSRRRILELAIELPDGRDFELHRPWIDRVVLRCPTCGGRALREPFVLDTWHNSGSSPYASFTDAEYRKLVPVGFLTEGIDQTRGWAYTLLVLNVLMTGRPTAPYKAFLFQGLVLDERGQKMSKSLGNVVQGLDFLREYSVDLARLYMISKASPQDAMNLDTKEMTGRPYQVLSTLYHLHVYLVQNGKVDGYDPSRHTLAWATRRGLLTKIDRWLLAKTAKAERSVDSAYEEARFNDAAKTLEDLVINHASQNYVRLVRGELWLDDPSMRERRLAIYSVLGHVLKVTNELLHPVSPFVTEYLYQHVFAPRPWQTPLLAVGRTATVYGRDSKSERSVDFALGVEEACNSARTQAKLKRRWPLRELKVLVPTSALKLAAASVPTIASLCNVKRVVIESKATRYPARFTLRPNGSRFGALFKERTREVLGSAGALRGDAALRAHRSGRGIKLAVGGKTVEASLAAYDLAVEPQGGYEVSENDGVFAAVSTARDTGMIAEGLARDVARRLQALRKERGFVPTDMLESAAIAGLDEEDLSLLTPLRDQIAFLVRVRNVNLAKEAAKGRNWSESDLDGKPLYLDVG